VTVVICPIEDAGLAGVAARNALEAAHESPAAIAGLPADLAGEKLRGVVTLHAGDMDYGNIGAADRFNFTVIGPAVNLVSRVETVAKRIDLPSVMSEDFAAAYGRPTASIGMHRPRGLPQWHELFTTDAIAVGVNSDRDVASG
jgi:adenylate cyclase